MVVRLFGPLNQRSLDFAYRRPRPILIWPECGQASHESAACSRLLARFRTRNSNISAAKQERGRRTFAKGDDTAHRAPDHLSPAEVLQDSLCDRIPTPAENSLGSYSRHTWAYRHSQRFTKGVRREKPGGSYEGHPLRASKKVRTAVGHPIPQAGADRAAT